MTSDGVSLALVLVGDDVEVGLVDVIGIATVAGEMVVEVHAALEEVMKGVLEVALDVLVDGEVTVIAGDEDVWMDEDVTVVVTDCSPALSEAAGFTSSSESDEVSCSPAFLGAGTLTITSTESSSSCFFGSECLPLFTTRVGID